MPEIDRKALAAKIDRYVHHMNIGLSGPGTSMYLQNDEWDAVLAAIRAPSSAEAMRERCAQVCDAHGDALAGQAEWAMREKMGIAAATYSGGRNIARWCAITIRALPLSPNPGSAPDERKMTDAERLDWLEKAARQSRTGISFDWVPSVEGEPSGWRFMRRFFIGPACKSLRGAIEAARRQVDGGFRD